jgi:hypothetical protein
MYLIFYVIQKSQKKIIIIISTVIYLQIMAASQQSTIKHGAVVYVRYNRCCGLWQLPQDNGGAHLILQYEKCSLRKCLKNANEIYNKNVII